MLAKSHSAEFWTGSQSAIGLGCHMVVDYRAIECNCDLQVFDLRRSVEKFPVLVGFDPVVPANTSDRFASREERVADHVAPRGFTDAFVFAAMHPDSAAIHQRAEEHGPAASALANSEDVEIVFIESLADSIEVQLGRHDLVVIQQEDELGVCSVYRRIATYADAHVVLFEVDHFAVLGRLGIFSRESVFL